MDPEFFSDFVCPACKHVVQEPLECAKCQTLFCKACRVSCCDEQAKAPSRILLNHLHKMPLACPSCKIVYPYKDHETATHAATCNREVVQTCLYEPCAAYKFVGPVTELQPSYEQHLASECAPIQEMRCSDCKEKFQAAQLMTHSCVKDLCEQIDSVSSRLYGLVTGACEMGP